MASKAMRITDHSCGTDTWRGAIQRRPTSGRSTSSRANYSMRSRLPDSKCAPEFSARTSLPSGSISNASPGHVAPAWRLSDARTYRPPHALRPHRSLQVRIEESPAGQTGGATLQGRRHGDRNGGRRGLARGPDPGGPSCASPIWTCHRFELTHPRDGFIGRRDRGFPAAGCPASRRSSQV
jgi:hypothetical protein